MAVHKEGQQGNMKKAQNDEACTAAEQGHQNGTEQQNRFDKVRESRKGASIGWYIGACAGRHSSVGRHDGLLMPHPRHCSTRTFPGQLPLLLPAWRPEMAKMAGLQRPPSAWPPAAAAAAAAVVVAPAVEGWGASCERFCLGCQSGGL